MIDLSQFRDDLKDIWMIDEESSSSNVYLLDGGKTLIDAGNLVNISDKIEEKFDTAKIERIFLTHGHFENIGGLIDILGKCSPVIYMHRADFIWAKLGNFNMKEVLSQQKNVKLRLIEDAQRFDLNNFSITAIYTPGHTPGSVCYADFDKGLLFSGHTVLRSEPDNWYVANVDPATGNKKLLLESITRLLNWNFEVLLPSHTAPDLFNANEQIKAAFLAIDSSLSDDDLCWMHLAAQLADRKRFNEAYEIYKYILQMDKKNSAAMLSMAFVELELGKFSEALKHFDDILKIKADKLVIKGKVAALAALGKTEEAEKLINRFHL